MQIKSYQEIFDNIENINFIDENCLIDGLSFSSVKNQLEKLISNSDAYVGWYFQQFLKMAYAFVCKDEYYLIWDSDTIPTNKIEMFENETKKAFFDTKSEFHKPYFETIKNLFPDLEKTQNFSYISEHMLIKTQIMKDLVSKIEENTLIKGNMFFEKILHSISIENIKNSGFSEYETYGIFASKYYKNEYTYRVWRSSRRADFFLDRENLNIKKINWCSSHFDAITFEKEEPNIFSKIFIKTPLYRIISYERFIKIWEFLSCVKKRYSKERC